MRRARRLRWPLAIVLVGTVGVGTVAAAVASRPRTVEIDIHYSHFMPSEVSVPIGVPVTFVLRNEDPIDHEWIVGDEAVHAFHRASADTLHTGKPNEVSLPALSTVTTTVTFTSAGKLAYICHLPGHEAYGMVGSVTIGS
jgi:uncharacterized cupredoxin-like copper-binding protein